MEKLGVDPSPRTIWAYGYEIAPPLSQDRLRVIEALVKDEHSSATLGARTWEGRLVVQEQVTHILVVSDSPDQDLEVNRKLEAELRRLEAGFSVTMPLAVVDRADSPSSWPVS
jgi:hypothetical protein